MKRLIAMIWFAGIIMCGFSQESRPHIGIYLGSGIELGWWIYQHGSNPAGQLGWDKTHLSLVLPVSARVEFKKGPFSIGLGAGSKLLNDNVMLGSDNRVGNRNRYLIVEDRQSIPINMAYVSGGYEIFNGKRFALQPLLKLGTFWLETTHPRADDFGFKGWMELGISTHVHLHPRVDFVATPLYSLMQINQKNPLASGERHRISSVGIQMGFLTWIW